MQDTNQFVATYDSLKTVIYDTETGKIITQFVNENPTSDSNYRINRLISHPSQPFIITAHEDKKIRYFDSNSGNNKKSVFFLNNLKKNILFRSNDSFNGRSS
jgi:WD40 repeat protein